MKISASRGRCSAKISIDQEVSKLTLTAEDKAERQWLAGLFPAIESGLNHVAIREHPPTLQIIKKTEPKTR